MENLKKIKQLLKTAIGNEKNTRVSFWSSEPTYGSFVSGETGALLRDQPGFPLLLNDHRDQDGLSAEKQVCKIYENYSSLSILGKLSWRFEHWNESIDDYRHFYAIIRLNKLKTGYTSILDRIENDGMPIYSLFGELLNSLRLYSKSCLPSQDFFGRVFQENNMALHNAFTQQTIEDCLKAGLRHFSMACLTAMNDSGNQEIIGQLKNETETWIRTVQENMAGIDESDIPEYQTDILNRTFEGIRFVLEGLVGRMCEDEKVVADISLSDEKNIQYQPLLPKQLADEHKHFIENEYQKLNRRLIQLESHCAVYIPYDKTNIFPFTWHVKLDAEEKIVSVHYCGEDAGKISSLSLKDMNASLELVGIEGLSAQAINTETLKKQAIRKLGEYHARTLSSRQTPELGSRVETVGKLSPGMLGERIIFNQTAKLVEAVGNALPRQSSPSGIDKLIAYASHVFSQINKWVFLYEEVKEKLQNQVKPLETTLAFINSEDNLYHFRWAAIDHVFSVDSPTSWSIKNALGKYLRDSCASYNELDSVTQRQVMKRLKLRITSQWLHSLLSATGKEYSFGEDGCSAWLFGPPSRSRWADNIANNFCTSNNDNDEMLNYKAVSLMLGYMNQQPEYSVDLKKAFSEIVSRKQTCQLAQAQRGEGGSLSRTKKSSYTRSDTMVLEKLKADRNQEDFYNIPEGERPDWEQWLIRIFENPEKIEYALKQLEGHAAHITKNFQTDLWHYTMLSILYARWIEAIRWKASFPVSVKIVSDKTVDQAKDYACSNLQKMWKRMALNYHPDKDTKSSESTEVTQKLNNEKGSILELITEAAESENCPQWIQCYGKENVLIFGDESACSKARQHHMDMLSQHVKEIMQRTDQTIRESEEFRKEYSACLKSKSDKQPKSREFKKEYSGSLNTSGSNQQENGKNKNTSPRQNFFQPCEGVATVTNNNSQAQIVSMILPDESGHETDTDDQHERVSGLNGS